jgi:hypothetical protein
MFVKRTSLTYWWPVTVAMPSADAPGTYDRQTFHALFDTLDREEARKLDAEIRRAEATGDTSLHDGLLLRVVKNWKDVSEEGKPGEVAFSAAALQAYCAAMPWFRIGLYRAWQESQQGMLPGN